MRREGENNNQQKMRKKEEDLQTRGGYLYVHVWFTRYILSVASDKRVLVLQKSRLPLCLDQPITTRH